mgnify:CR=1 FL=1
MSVLSDTAPLQEDDFLDIIEPLPAPSELPYIKLASKTNSQPVQVFDLTPPVTTNNFVRPPSLTLQ